MSVKGTWIRKKRISDEEWAESHARIFGERPEKKETDESEHADRQVRPDTSQLS
jgi:hypothetical protein